MKTRVKICGLTSLEDARFCAAAGADYLGFVLVESSPRHVTPDHAREIVAWIRGPRTVGVFSDADPDTVNRVVRDVGFDMVQLHGRESVSDCRRILAPVIKVIPVTSETPEPDLETDIECYRDVSEFILLDTAVNGATGGTGRTFDWQIAVQAARRISLFMAGGLSPDNVSAAVQRVHPFGVDVSSGVEAAPGVKDFDKVTSFIDAATGSLETG